MRIMPRKPTSAVGSSRSMPSSIPSPARRIGTTSGLGVESLHAGRRRDRGRDVDRLDAHVAGGLVGQQRDQLVGEPAERRGVGALVPQHRELVRDERVVGDVDLHAPQPSGVRPRCGGLSVGICTRGDRPHA